jgi:hypothetical protein
MLAGLLLGRNQAMIPCQHGGIEVYPINLYTLVDDFIWFMYDVLSVTGGGNATRGRGRLHRKKP